MVGSILILTDLLPMQQKSTLKILKMTASARVVRAPALSTGHLMDSQITRLEEEAVIHRLSPWCITCSARMPKYPYCVDAL